MNRAEVDMGPGRLRRLTALATARYQEIVNAPRGTVAEKQVACTEQWRADMREADSSFGQAVD